MLLRVFFHMFCLSFCTRLGYFSSLLISSALTSCSPPLCAGLTTRDARGPGEVREGRFFGGRKGRAQGVKRDLANGWRRSLLSYFPLLFLSEHRNWRNTRRKKKEGRRGKERGRLCGLRIKASQVLSQNATLSVSILGWGKGLFYARPRHNGDGSYLFCNSLQLPGIATWAGTL